MKNIIKNFTLLFILCNLSCKEKIEYKYANEKNLIVCSDKNSVLVKEAVYTFENYLKKNYKYRDLNSLNIVYANFWPTIHPKAHIKIDSLSKHITNLLESLKNQNILIKEDGHTRVNPNAPIMDCIGDNINDKGLKTTFNALLKTNSFKSETFIPAIGRNTKAIANDKALSTYIALELFYAKISDMDFSISDRERALSSKANPIDSHEGHNH